MAAASTLPLPKPWPDFLKEIDAQLSQAVKLHCLGGFVLTALYGIPRFTADLDYIDAAPPNAVAELEKIAGRESALCKKYKLFVQNVGIADAGGLRIATSRSQRKYEETEIVGIGAL